MVNMFNKIKDYFSLKQMKKEIYGYGYTVSGIKYLLMTIISISITIGFSLLYQMQIGYTIIVAFISIAVIPLLIRAKFINLYQKKRFNEVDIYLHQMVYSFQKKPKILTALEDTIKVSTGKLKKTLEIAIENLYTSSSENLYEESFKIIEKEYNNSRVKALNKYMLNIEKTGGEYSNSINIMLVDIDSWINRTYMEQAEVERIKFTNMIGLLIGFIMGSVCSIFSYYMNHSQYVSVNGSVADDVLYQIGCLVFLVVCVLFYTYTQVGYNRDWVSKELNKKIVMKDYKTATEFNPNKLRIMSIPIYIFFIILAIVVYFIKAIPFRGFISTGFIAFDIYLVISPKLQKNGAVARTKKNIQNSFSEWLRDVSLNLQKEPLLSAIQDTYDECPVVLKPELELFLTRIEENPTAVEPYYEFLARFHILDISSAIRNLYSISDNNSEDMDKQLNSLIERNYSIINKNEIASYEDRNAALHFSENIPIIIASIKLGIDMLALISIFI